MKDTLPRVSPERIREELERMLVHDSRALAWRLIAESGLLAYLWLGAAMLAQRTGEIISIFNTLPTDIRFELALAVELGLEPVAALATP